jgi:hypothetical protein
MYDVESAWAEFAEVDPFAPPDAKPKAIREAPFTPTDPFSSSPATRGGGGAPSGGGSPRLRDELKGAIKGGYRSAKAIAKKTGQLTVATSRRGLKFLRRVGARASGVTGTAASRGVGLVGRGVSKAGGLIGRAGAAIGRNPKMAGAALIGGAAVGAGAYAVNRRRRSESSRYLGGYASFSRRRYYR